MPCYDSSYYDSSPSSAAREKLLREFRHNSPVAELLCEAMRLLRDRQPVECSQALLEWWEDHQKRDAGRE